MYYINNDLAISIKAIERNGLKTLQLFYFCFSEGAEKYQEKNYGRTLIIIHIPFWR